MDSWLRGLFFITRLPEFLFGMSLATWMFREPKSIHAALRNPGTILVALMVYGVATLVALTLPGMIFAPAIFGVAAFVLLYALFTSNILEGREHLRWLAWVGVHSYSIYLLHGIFIEALVPDSVDGAPLFRNRQRYPLDKSANGNHFWDEPVGISVFGFYRRFF